ncbi:MAG: PHP domain-containing protein [Promethearchaeota archaeon]
MAFSLLIATSTISVVIWQVGWLGFVGRFLSYTGFIMTGIAASVITSVLGPPRFMYNLKSWQDERFHYKPLLEAEEKEAGVVLLDTHSHTLASDGKMTYEQSVWYHIAMGFTAMAFTDHETLGDVVEIKRLQEEYRDKMIILQGIEIGTKIGHVCVIGVETWDQSRYKSLSGEQKVMKIVEMARDQNAVVSINHYPWSTGGEKPRFDPSVHLSRDRALELGFQLMEACNWDDDISPIDMASYIFCRDHDGIGSCAATDIHAPEKDKLYGWTKVNPRAFSEAALMDELRAGRTDVLFQPGGAPYPTLHDESLAYRAFRPLYMVGDMFVTLHQGARVSNVKKGPVFVWFAWLYAMFILSELVKFLFSP